MWAVDTVVPMPSWFSLIVQGGSFALLAYLVVIMGPKLYHASLEERQAREKASREERDERERASREERDQREAASRTERDLREKLAREERDLREKLAREERDQRDRAFHEALVLLQMKTDERAAAVAVAINAQTIEFNKAIAAQTTVLKTAITTAAENSCRYLD